MFRSGQDFSARVELSAHVLRKGAVGSRENFLGGRILPLAANVYREVGAVAGPRRAALLEFPSARRAASQGKEHSHETDFIRYKTKPETTEENQRLIENVFRELQTKSVDGFRYVVLKLGDGSFLHFFEAEDGASPMTGIDAFQLFQAGIRDRCLEPPQVSEAAVTGNYRMLSEQ